MTQPLWLADPGIQRLLNHLLDKLEAADAQGKELVRAIKLDVRAFPHFFKADLEEERERLWACLKKMVRWEWLDLKTDRVPSGQAEYQCNPRVVVLQEAALRKVTNRPERVKSSTELWREAVVFGLAASEDVRESAVRYRIEIPGRAAEEIVQRLNLLPTLAEEPLLLREVSARLFWGQSKVLDNRQSLVAALLGVKDCPFPEMPVQVLAFLPNVGFDGVLFIENQTTFEQATRDTSGRFARLALVFASGFKGSAKRLRSPTGASVYFASHGATDDLRTGKFLGWLRNGVELSSWFWGDLDYAGMQILAALRSTFPTLEAWQPGYQPMLEALKRGEGHPPEAAGKAMQLAIIATGCNYADAELLPAMKAAGRFVDQELI